MERWMEVDTDPAVQRSTDDYGNVHLTKPDGTRFVFDNEYTWTEYDDEGYPVNIDGSPNETDLIRALKEWY